MKYWRQNAYQWKQTINRSNIMMKEKEMSAKPMATKTTSTMGKKTSVSTKNKSWGDRHRVGIKK